jgi:hypothetical protein
MARCRILHDPPPFAPIAEYRRELADRTLQ